MEPPPLTEAESSSRPLREIGFLAVVLLVVFTPALIIGRCERRALDATFSNHLAEYVAMAKFEESSDGPYIAGKIVMIDTGEPIEDLWDDVNDTSVDVKPMTIASIQRHDHGNRLFAKTAEEVSTVVLLDWQRHYVGTYGGTGIRAYSSSCEVTLIDLARKRVIGRSQFAGAATEHTYATGATERNGTGPFKEIWQYLTNLPRREVPQSAAAPETAPGE